MRRTQPAGRARFTLETLACFFCAGRAERNFGTNQLHGCKSAEKLVAREPYFAHAAGTDQIEQRIGADLLALGDAVRGRCFFWLGRRASWVEFLWGVLLSHAGRC